MMKSVHIGGGVVNLLLIVLVTLVAAQGAEPSAATDMRLEADAVATFKLNERNFSVPRVEPGSIELVETGTAEPVTAVSSAIAVTATAVSAARYTSKFAFFVLDKVGDKYIDRERKNYQAAQSMLTDQMCQLLFDGEFLKMSRETQAIKGFGEAVGGAALDILRESGIIERDVVENLGRLRAGVDSLTQALRRGFRAVKSQVDSDEPIGMTTLVMGVHAATMGNCIKPREISTRRVTGYALIIWNALVKLKEATDSLENLLRPFLEKNEEIAHIFEELDTAKKVAIGFVRKFKGQVKATLAPLSEFTSDVFQVQRMVVNQVKHVLKTSCAQITSELLGQSGKAVIHEAAHHSTVVFGAVSLSYNSALLARDIFRGAAGLFQKTAAYKLLKFFNTKKLRFLNFSRCRQMATSLHRELLVDKTISDKNFCSSQEVVKGNKVDLSRYSNYVEGLGKTPKAAKDVTPCDMLFTKEPGCLLQCFMEPVRIRPGESLKACPLVLGWNEANWKNVKSFEEANKSFAETKEEQPSEPPKWIHDFEVEKASCRTDFKQKDSSSNSRAWDPKPLNNGKWCLYTTKDPDGSVPDDSPITSVSLQPDVVWTETMAHGRDRRYWKGPVIRVGKFEDSATDDIDVRESLEGIDPFTGLPFDKLVGQKRIVTEPDARLKYTKKAEMRREAASYNPDLSKPFCGGSKVTTRWASQRCWALITTPKTFDETTAGNCNAKHDQWLYEHQSIANHVIAECVYLDEYMETLGDQGVLKESDVVVSPFDAIMSVGSHSDSRFAVKKSGRSRCKTRQVRGGWMPYGTRNAWQPPGSAPSAFTSVLMEEANNQYCTGPGTRLDTCRLAHMQTLEKKTLLSGLSISRSPGAIAEEIDTKRGGGDWRHPKMRQMLKRFLKSRREYKPDACLTLLPLGRLHEDDDNLMETPTTLENDGIDENEKTAGVQGDNVETQSGKDKKKDEKSERAMRNGILLGRNEISGEVISSFHISKSPGTGMPILNMEPIDCNDEAREAKTCFEQNRICDVLNVGRAQDRCNRDWVLNLDEHADKTGSSYQDQGTCPPEEFNRLFSFSAPRQSLKQAFVGLRLEDADADTLLGENGLLQPSATVSYTQDPNEASVCILIEYDSKLYIPEYQSESQTKPATDEFAEPNFSSSTSLWKNVQEQFKEEAKARLKNTMQNYAEISTGYWREGSEFNH